MLQTIYDSLVLAAILLSLILILDLLISRKARSVRKSGLQSVLAGGIFTLLGLTTILTPFLSSKPPLINVFLGAFISLGGLCLSGLGFREIQSDKK